MVNLCYYFRPFAVQTAKAGKKNRLTVVENPIGLKTQARI